MRWSTMAINRLLFIIIHRDYNDQSHNRISDGFYYYLRGINIQLNPSDFINSISVRFQYLEISQFIGAPTTAFSQRLIRSNCYCIHHYGSSSNVQCAHAGMHIVSADETPLLLKPLAVKRYVIDICSSLRSFRCSTLNTL